MISCCLILVVVVVLHADAQVVQIAPHPSSYSRTVQTSNGWLVSCMERGISGTHGLGIRWSNDKGHTWSGATLAVVNTELNGQLGNCDILELPSGRFLIAYRHHSNCTRNKCGTYRIQTRISTSTDITTTSWTTNAAVVAETARGPGLWEPKLFQLNDTTTMCLYSREMAPKDQRVEQMIVTHYSSDGGMTWSGYSVVAYNPGSRNGMPGIDRLKSTGDLVVVFESFWETWGHFLVSMVRSKDNGRTWQPRRKVYESHIAGRNAGAPQVAVAHGSGNVIVSFLCNEDSKVPPNWPQDAVTKVVLAEEASVLQFNASIQVSQRLSLWPNVFPVDSYVLPEFGESAALLNLTQLT